MTYNKKDNTNLTISDREEYKLRIVHEFRLQEQIKVYVLGSHE